MKPTTALLTPTNEKALVRFMRPSGFGYAINFNIWDGDKVIGNSVAKSQFDYLANPGKHIFVAIAENKSFVEAELEAGKVYYVLTQVKMGVWKARVGLIPVNKGSKLWGAVKEYEINLNKLQPDTNALKTWEDTRKDDIKTVLMQSTANQWPKLNIEDGR